MPKHLRSYKGRVVFRGDQVRDEAGFYAVFSEQGTSASHLAAAKFIDAISRFPDCDGENADASSAYTQVRFEDLIADGHDIPETWTSLPKHIRPPSWANIPDPVCRLEVNLYGHPLAGLY